MDNGFIKLYRSIDQNELLMNDNTAFIVFIKLLLLVDWKTGKCVTGRNKLAVHCNLNPATLYSALKRLESSSMIQQQSNNASTTIYICNWWKYQQDVNNKSSARHQPVNTIQEEEKEEVYISEVGAKRDKNLLASINKLLDRDFRVLPRGSKATMKKFTDEEIGKALKNLLKDPWHRARIKQLKSDYLLRASTIDNFLNYKTVGEQAIEKKPVKSVSSKDFFTRSELLQREYS